MAHRTLYPTFPISLLPTLPQTTTVNLADMGPFRSRLSIPIVVAGVPRKLRWKSIPNSFACASAASITYNHTFTHLYSHTRVSLHIPCKLVVILKNWAYFWCVGPGTILEQPRGQEWNRYHGAQNMWKRKYKSLMANPLRAQGTAIGDMTHASEKRTCKMQGSA